jgi:hypothetical protein
MLDDLELLRRYAHLQDESAFSILVARHTSLVYSAAQRQSGGDSGVPLQGALDCKAVGQIANLSHRIISSLVLYLLRNPVQAHSLIEKQEAPSVRELVLEGKSIIEASCGLEKFDLMEPDMPLLQVLLSQIPPTQAQEHFRYDMRAGVIYVRCRLLREVTRKPLYDAL